MTPNRSGSRAVTPGPLVSSLLALSILAAPPRAVATQVSLPAVRDNTMYAEDGTLSNGAGQHFFAGNTKDGFARRGLVSFNIASNIPAGATINSVTLSLYESRGKFGTYDVSLHRILADWGEGSSVGAGEEGQGAPADSGQDATWTHRFWPDVPWTSSGGDYVSGASATTAVGSQNGTITWTSATMVADVQSWLDNGLNFGWILIGDESTTQTTRRFDTRENGTTTHRPVLTIDYTSGGAVTGACCLGDSCAVMTATECSNQGGVYQGDDTLCSPSPCVVATGACCFDDGTCQDTTQTACSAQGGTYQGDGSSCATTSCPLVLTAFVDSLPIPPLAVPTSGTQGGVATYDIPIVQFQHQMHRDLPPTTVWGYDGEFPGPTILAFRDQPVTVNWINDLRDSTGALRTTHYFPVDLCPHGAANEPKTVVHLHGGHVPAAVDGYPEETFLPGEQATYVYPNNQQAGTLWYHDHALGITRLNVMMGLAGAYVVRDSAEIGLSLPPAPYDIPLIIQDRTLNADGSLTYPATVGDHFLGDHILVNGKVWPVLSVRRGKYRFRVLNGSNARFYTLHLSTGNPFQVIATDDGLLPAPVTVDSLTISNGERYEIVIDFDLYGPGTEITLLNSAPAPYPGPPGVGVIPNVMKFVVLGGAKGFTGSLPGTLVPVPAIPESTAVVTRDLVLDKRSEPCSGSEWLINGLHWDDITERPVIGTTEIWRFINDSGMSHPMHMHLVAFQVLDRTPVTVSGDSVIVTGPPVTPAPAEQGWKDTAPVAPNEMLRVIARFEDYLGKYPYHCHILEHEDHEMMRQFEVVDSVAVAVAGLPERVAFSLGPNRPNPFGGATTVNFALPAQDRVTIRVFDIRGRLVDTLADGIRSAGTHEVVWDGRGSGGARVANGIYFIELESGDYRAVRKATVLR